MNFGSHKIQKIKKAAGKTPFGILPKGVLPAAFLILWILWLPKSPQVAGFWKWVGFVFEGVIGPQVFT